LLGSRGSNEGPLAGLVNILLHAGGTADTGYCLHRSSVFKTVTSEPLRKAIVTLDGLQIGRLLDETDAAGKFQFTGLPPGTYGISASHTGFIDRAARRPITLGPNQDVSDSEIRLPPEAVIAGSVLDEDGDPAPEGPSGDFQAGLPRGQEAMEQFRPGDYE
jgi:Carboxypeptidase regulatory-like domain